MKTPQVPALDGMSPLGLQELKPATITEQGETWHGHWHGNIAIFNEYTAFRTGHGWCGQNESKRLYASLCHHYHGNA